MPIRGIERAIVATHDIASDVAAYQRALELPIVSRGSRSELDIDFALLGAGTGFIELIQPRSTESPVHSFLERRGGPALYAMGLLSDDLQADVKALTAAGVRHREVDTKSERGTAVRVVWPNPQDMHGASYEIRGHQETEPREHPYISQIWQCSPLVSDIDQARSCYDLIVKGARVETGSVETFGYRHHTLHLGEGPHAQSFELCYPFDSAKPMGRYYQRWGPSLYMITLDVNDLSGVVRAFESRGIRYIPGSPRVGFLHPKETPGCFICLLEAS